MHLSNHETTQYASGADFCRIFVEEMNGLYLLSFLLTGEHSLAEECFLRGLEDSRGGKPVFKEWAGSWVRRTLVQKAIQMVHPMPPHKRASRSSSQYGGMSRATEHPAEIANIVWLPVFERFVFVMSVLEHYSCRECSLLLDCTRNDIITAQTWVLLRIAGVAELPLKMGSSTLDEQPLTDSSGSRPQRAPSTN